MRDYYHTTSQLISLPAGPSLTIWRHLRLRGLYIALTPARNLVHIQYSPNFWPKRSYKAGPFHKNCDPRKFRAIWG